LAGNDVLTPLGVAREESRIVYFIGIFTRPLKLGRVWRKQCWRLRA